MNIYGISDLHLSGNPPYKNMEHFGTQYTDYIKRMEIGFKALPSNSWVINAGDISWAINREEALQDLLWLDSFGINFLHTIGNHDYFWGKKSAEFMYNWAVSCGLKHTYFVDHQKLFEIGNEFGKISVAATKGVETYAQLELELDISKLPPGHQKSVAVVPKYWEKYKRRLTMIATELKPNILVSHIPPFKYDGTPNELTEIIYKSSIKMVLFGHRHKAPALPSDLGCIKDIIWHNLLAERCNFTPRLLGAVEEYGTCVLYGGNIPIPDNSSALCGRGVDN